GGLRGKRHWLGRGRSLRRLLRWDVDRRHRRWLRLRRHRRHGHSRLVGRSWDARHRFGIGCWRVALGLSLILRWGLNWDLPRLELVGDVTADHIGDDVRDEDAANANDRDDSGPFPALIRRHAKSVERPPSADDGLAKNLTRSRNTEKWRRTWRDLGFGLAA